MHKDEQGGLQEGKIGVQVADTGRLPGVGRGGIGRRLLQLAKSKPLGVAGAVLLLALVALAVTAPLFAPYDPFAHDLSNPWSGPSSRHWLGTDQYGRDTLSRLLLGARYSLLIAFAATLGGGTVGALLGLVSGYFGGYVDLAVQRWVDIQMAIPPLLLTLLVVTAVGPSVPGVIIALGIGMMPRTTRVVRSVALATREMTFVEAARALGAGHARIMFLHVLPSCVAPYIVILSVSIGGLIVAEASLGSWGWASSLPLRPGGRCLAGPWRPFG
ncbi:putative D,D-dipeptide transport system permease protein DdpC [bacterium HR23]|nr:putative D,D-dipeptide transport system permease protein DdpC [bacterium HR23]